MEITDQMRSDYIANAQEDPMYPIMVAGEAISNVLRYAQEIPDLNTATEIVLPIHHIASLQLALGMLTKVLEEDNAKNGITEE